MLAFIVANPWRAACLGMLLLLGVQTWRMDSWRDQAVAEATAHKLTKANYKKAQAESEAKHRKAIADQEKKYRDDARKADLHARETLAAAATRADAYIARNRVRPEAAAGPASRPAPPAEGGSAPSDNRPGGEAELVVVKAEDVRICTRNTGRLEEARNWGLGINP